VILSKSASLVKAVIFKSRNFAGGGGPASIAGNAGKIERATKGKEIRRPNFPLTGQSVGSTDRSSDAGLGMGGFAGRNETSGYCPLA
jgi:hypothetical protein